MTDPSWNLKAGERAARLARARAALGPRLAGKRVDAGAITELLHAVLAPGDRVCLEGNNQKQADFLAGALVQLDPQQVHDRSEEHTSELQSRLHLVCRLLLEKKKTSHHDCETSSPMMRTQFTQSYDLRKTHLCEIQLDRPPLSLRYVAISLAHSLLRAAEAIR